MRAGVRRGELLPVAREAWILPPVPETVNSQSWKFSFLTVLSGREEQQ
jgi:hypothetical protein